MSPREVQTMMLSTVRHVSLDAPIANSEDSDATMLDLYSSDDAPEPDLNLMAESLREEVAHGLAMLSPREMEVIASYYGLKGYPALTLEEIAELYGLTRERVRQIKERAIRRLRKSSKALKSYLG